MSEATESTEIGGARVFRIFVSSTFDDMKAEREALQQHVFPKLREFCQWNGYHFQAIDLRWGVSEEAGLDQRTMTICLDELKRCQKDSPRANCLILLGNRYGWQPLPPRIEAAEMEMLMAQMNAPDQQHVQRWYQVDRNAVPVEYVLFPRTGDFVSSIYWQREEYQILRALSRAAEVVLADAVRRARYHQSATHQEIVAGLLDAEGAEQHVFACLRDLPELPCTAAGAGFLDLTLEGDFDQSAWDRNEALKQEIRNRLPPENVYSYQGAWPYKPGRECLSELCRHVEAHFTRILHSEMSQRGRDAEAAQENQEHLRFARDRAKSFVGRREALSRIVDYVRGSEPYPLFLHGPSGSGKTALMARAFLGAREDAGSRSLVFARLVGATPRSSLLRTLLDDLVRQLDCALGREGADVPSDVNGLVSALQQRLALAACERPVVLFLDALDQLESSDSPETLFWLPRQLPRHVRLVVSLLERPLSPAGKAAEFSRHIFPEEARYLIEPLGRAEGEALLDGWLGDACRTPQPEQRQAILEVFANSGSPLWLRLVTDQALTWHSFDRPRTLPESISALIGRRLDELSLPQHHGELLLARVFGYLAAAKSGLSEDELLDILARDDELWSHFVNTSRHSIPAGQRRLPVVLWARLHLDLRGFFCELSVDYSRLFGFYHRQLAEAASERFLSASLHSRLADYFFRGYRASDADSWGALLQPSYRAVLENQPSAWRALTELPYQLHGANQMSELAGLLGNYDFLTAKCAANRADLLLDDLALLDANGDRLPGWDEFLRARSPLLRRGNSTWPAHRILWQLTHELPGAHPVRVVAEKWFARFRPTEALLIRAFNREGEPEPACLTVELQKNLLDCQEKHRRKRLDRLFGREVGCIDTIPEAIAESCGTASGRETEVLPIGEEALVVRYSDREVAILSQKTGKITAAVELAEDRIHTLGILGTIFAVLTESGDLQLFDISTGALLFLDAAEASNVAGVATLNQDNFLAWYRDGWLVVRSKRTGRVVLRKDCGKNLSRVLVLDNGYVLACDLGGHVTVLNPALDNLFAGQLLRSAAHGAGHLAGEKTVIWDDAGGMMLLDWSDLARSRSLEGHAARTEGILPYDDGTFVSWSVDSVIQLWKPGRASPVVRKVNGILGHLTKGPDDTLVAIYVGDHSQTHQTIEAYRAWPDFAEYATPDRERVYYFADHIGILSLSASTFQDRGCLEPKAKGGILGAFEVAGSQLVTWSLSAPVALWRFNGQKVRELPDISLRTLDRLVLVSPQRFLSVHTDGRVWLWDAVNGRAVRGLAPIQGRISHVQSLSGDRFATLTEDLNIRIWDTTTGRPLACLSGHGSLVRGLLQRSPQKLVSWTQQGEIKLWDLDEEAVRQKEALHADRFDHRGGGMASIVKRVSATSIVSCHWGVIKSWDARSGEMIARLDLIPDNINCLEVLCEDVVLFWCRGFTVWNDLYLWRVADPRPLARFNLFPRGTNVDDVWTRNVGSVRKPIYEVCIQGADRTEFVFRFDERLQPLGKSASWEDGVRVFLGKDHQARPLTRRVSESSDYSDPMGRQTARHNVHDQGSQRYVAIESTAGVMQWHTHSPAALVEHYSDGLYCVALASGEIELLFVQ